jgi:hypothetical protein
MTAKIQPGAHHSFDVVAVFRHRGTADDGTRMIGDAQGYSGWSILMSDGQKDVRLCLATDQLDQTDAGLGKWWYVLATAGDYDSGDFAEIGRRWYVDPYVPHRVELHVFDPDWVYVVIDGKIVDRWPYEDFEAASDGLNVYVQTEWATDTPTNHQVRLRDADYQVRQCDMTRRPHFLLALNERDLLVSGCERNDELELWGRRIWGVESLRGTTRGIDLETERLACQDAVTLFHETSRIDWHLEMTYPELTPIFLEASGVISLLTVEFGFHALNYTKEELAEYLCRHVFPSSTGESKFVAAYASTLMGGSSVVSGNTRLPIPAADVGHWAVGDAAHVRKADNSFYDDGTVVTVGATYIEISPVTDHTYAASDVVRKTLAHS